MLVAVELGDRIASTRNGALVGYYAGYHAIDWDAKPAAIVKLAKVVDRAFGLSEGSSQGAELIIEDGFSAFSASKS